MLTVRHIEPNGYEFIRETTGVWRDPADPDQVFAAADEGAEPVRFATGKLYVMNEAGKTVATYHLPWPSKGD
jgi:hypothetical protein